MADEKRLASQDIESFGPKQPWDRRRDETKRAFAAFCLFRDSTDRKLATVAKALTPPCSVPNVARWSTRHNWQERAVEYCLELVLKRRAPPMRRKLKWSARSGDLVQGEKGDVWPCGLPSMSRLSVAFRPLAPACERLLPNMEFLTLKWKGS
jgi:hypothetical protein